MGNKPGSSLSEGNLVSSPTGGSAESLMDRQRSKHKSLRDLKAELNIDPASFLTPNEFDVNDSTQQEYEFDDNSRESKKDDFPDTVPLKTEPDTNLKPSNDNNDHKQSVSWGADLANDMFGDQPSPIPKPKPKPMKKRKQKKVYTRSGYDLTPAIVITPMEKRIKGIGIDHIYRSLKVIAEGGSCSVLLVRHIKSRREYALKQMLSDNKYNPAMFNQEITALTDLKEQPNVLKHYDHYIDDECLYLITEFCSGGSLLDKILSLEHFNEAMASAFIRTILDAIAYMHARDLIHRDLKPENIVFSVDPYGKDILKIIDFGDSITLPDDSYTTIYAGTRPYMAPTLFKTKAKEYFTHLTGSSRKRYFGHELKKADVWSTGVICYVLVCGRLPFNGTRDQLPGLICRGKYRWPSDIPLSDSCKDFIDRVLVFDPEERLSAEQALTHEWLVSAASTVELGATFGRTLREFNSTTKLTKLLVKTIWNVASDSERKLIKYGLKKITHDSDGVLTTQQMFDYMMNYCHVNEKDEFYVQCTADELRNLMDIPDNGIHVDNIDVNHLMSSFSIARDNSIYGQQLAGYTQPKLDVLMANEAKSDDAGINSNGNTSVKVMMGIIEKHNEMASVNSPIYDAKKLASQMVDSDGNFDSGMAFDDRVDLDESQVGGGSGSGNESGDGKKKKKKKKKKSGGKSKVSKLWKGKNEKKNSKSKKAGKSKIKKKSKK